MRLVSNFLSTSKHDIKMKYLLLLTILSLFSCETKSKEEIEAQKIAKLKERAERELGIRFAKTKEEEEAIKKQFPRMNNRTDINTAEKYENYIDSSVKARKDAERQFIEESKQNEDASKEFPKLKTEKDFYLFLEKYPSHKEAYISAQGGAAFKKLEDKYGIKK